MLRTARPRQWPKNLLVFAAPLAGASLGRHDGLLYALVAAAAFGFASVAVYFVNDVVDAERDRLHPRKRHRPVAAGELPKRHAMVLGAVCAAGRAGRRPADRGAAAHRDGGRLPGPVVPLLVVLKQSR